MSRIRAATPDDVERLQAIEFAAGAAFVHIGMPEIAADDPLPADELERYRAAGRSWVVTDEGDRAVAYLVADVVDDLAHVEQVSVHPDHGRQGIGRRLLDHVAEWARTEGHTAITLTTFRDVPWNAPYYEHCGYRVLPDDERGPELVARMAHEAALGLDPTQRVAMCLDLP